MSSSHRIPKAVLYYDARSVWSLAVLVALEEKGYGKDEVDLRLVDYSKGENFSPSFLRLNPKGTLPTLIVPLADTLSSQMENRYKPITDTEALIAFLDKSRSIMSHTHTTSAAPAPVLSPATVAMSSTANSIITLLHSTPASPELLFYLNARDLPVLRTVAPGVLAFLKGRKEALERYLSENESKEVRVSEKTKTFWLDQKSATEDLLLALEDADKSDSELSESGRKAREEYFEKTKAAWGVDLAFVLNKLCKEFVGPFALGEQISIVDVHLAAWLHELVVLSGGSARDSGSVAMARLEEHVGGGFAFAKDVALPLPGASLNGSELAPTATAAKAKLAVVWDALASRPSWQKVFGVEAVEG